MIETLSVAAVGGIVVHAVWCLLCRRVSDGIIGKLLYLLLSLAAFSYLSHPSHNSQMLLNVSFFAIGVRHWWMKSMWKHVKRTIQHFFQGKHP